MMAETERLVSGANGALGEMVTSMAAIKESSDKWEKVDYRTIQLAKLRNVEVRTGVRLCAEQVLDYGAELVVIATGCSYATDGLNHVSERSIPGADATSDWQLTPPEVMRGTKPIGERVVIVDYEEYFVGASIAQRLAGQGHRVTIVTPSSRLAPFTYYTLESAPLYRDLARLGVEIVVDATVTQIERGGCHVASLWNPADVLLSIVRWIGNDNVSQCEGRC